MKIKYLTYNSINMFIVILDHDNIGTDTIIMTLPLLLAKIFPKIEFLVIQDSRFKIQELYSHCIHAMNVHR